MGLYLAHPSSLEHETGSHPENAGRVRAIEARLEDAGWPGLVAVEAPPVSRRALRRVHPDEYVESIERFCFEGGGLIDADTIASERSFDAALHAAGGATDAAERLLAGEDRWAFCGLRPPGHHAERARAMGFCLFNNVAVAAAHAIAECGVERVLVLDWDVHHGNGTEAIFAAAQSVLYASIHQEPLYPGTGPAGYSGEAGAEGYTVNLPVPPGAGSDVFLSLVQNVVAPIARAYEPGLIAISAGYDAHRDDPLSECTVDTECYGELASTVGALAAELGVPLLLCLEGGYNREALSASVLATVQALANGAEPSQAPVEPARPYVERQREHWPQI